MPSRGRTPRTTDAPPQLDPLLAALATMQQEMAAARQQDRELQMTANADMLQAVVNALQPRAQAPPPPPPPPPENVGGQGTQELEARERRYNAFRKHSPPHFKGGIDAVAAVEWIQELERIFRVMECDGHSKLLYATYMLQGDATDWWNNTRIRLEGQGQVMTWQIFEQQFLNCYFPEEVRLRKKHEFEELKQGSMSIDEYLAKFNRLAKYSTFRRAPLSSEDLVFHFKGGLHNNIAEKLADDSGTDFGELIKKCKNIQEYYRKKHRDMATSSGPQKNFNHGPNKNLHVKQQGGKFKNKGNANKQGQAKMENNNQSNFRRAPLCNTCGRYHNGVCRLPNVRCYNCNQLGHYKDNCPMLGAQVAAIQAAPVSYVNEEQLPPPPPQNARVYAIHQEEADQAPNLI